MHCDGPDKEIYCRGTCRSNFGENKKKTLEIETCALMLFLCVVVMITVIVAWKMWPKCRCEPRLKIICPNERCVSLSVFSLKFNQRNFSICVFPMFLSSLFLIVVKSSPGTKNASNVATVPKAWTQFSAARDQTKIFIAKVSTKYVCAYVHIHIYVCM